MKRVLITGGLGFVGGRLADHLRKRMGETEIVLGVRPRRTALPEWAGDFRTASMDLRRASTLSEAVDGVDCVIHLAAMNADACMADPMAAWDVNVLGTLRLLEAAHAAGASGVVYFSTAHVYAPQGHAPVTEQWPTGNPHPYAATHRAAEDVAMFFGRWRGMRVACFRLSNAFGAPMDPGANCWMLAAQDFCRQAAAGGPIVLNSSGRQHRDFIPMADVCEAVAMALQGEVDAWGQGPLNLGSGTSMSIADMAATVARIHAQMSGGPEADIRTNPRPGEGPAVPVRFSVDRLAALGFSPSASAENEIRDCLALCMRAGT